MAWTDAARKAAAEARKAHSGAKQMFSGLSKRNLSGDPSASGRKDLARQLKSLRKPNGGHFSGRHSEFKIGEITSAAAASTRLRNLGKKK